MFRKRIISMEMERKDHGFTLLEVLITMAIFAIGILAVFTLQINSISANTAAGMYTEANAIAVERMERLMAMPFNDTENGGPEVFGRYTVSWMVTDDTPIPAMTMTDPSNPTGPSLQITVCKTINVNVAWANLGGAKQISLDFIKTNT
ncbi:MAG: prepilin-type N-terminal cleavage/methylation domain-containing protein [Desulfobacterales bacterium]|nr:prepilin-type N-terminal cleavage/methylation domain-containing protein [Desulfobacterales bacterium]